MKGLIYAQNTMALNKSNDYRVTPERIIETYDEEGMTITLDQAKQILEFMYLIADITLDIAEKKLKRKTG